MEGYNTYEVYWQPNTFQVASVLGVQFFAELTGRKA